MISRKEQEQAMKKLKHMISELKADTATFNHPLSQQLVHTLSVAVDCLEIALSQPERPTEDSEDCVIAGQCIEHKGELYIRLSDVEKCVDRFKKRERPKGRWGTVWHGEFIATLECSACGRRINVDYPLRERTIKRKYPYCHCGADMRDGEEE